MDQNKGKTKPPWESEHSIIKTNPYVCKSAPNEHEHKQASVNTDQWAFSDEMLDVEEPNSS